MSSDENSQSEKQEGVSSGRRDSNSGWAFSRAIGGQLHEVVGNLKLTFPLLLMLAINGGS